MIKKEKSFIMEQQDKKLREQLSKIKHKILVMSGKGGVGKSTVAVNIAVGLSLQDFMVGLLDVDLHGPNVPKMLGARDLKLSRRPDGRLGAIKYSPNLKFLSIEPLLPSEDTAIIWRGPIKHSAIRQFIGDIDWGELDYLVIDSPPGTGDEPLTVAKTIPDAYALIVTTPQEVSLIDVKKAIRFCQKIKLRILGIVENMSGFICPHCGKPVDIFKKGGGQKLADELGIRFLGRIPVDPRIVDTGDAGKPLIAAYPESVTAKAFEELVRNIIVATEEMKKDILEEKFMRIAIPISTPSKIETDPEKFELFALYDVENNKILVKDVVKKAENQGLIDFLKEQVVTHVLLFDPPKELADYLSQNEIKVLVTDTSTETPDSLIEEYLKEKQLH
ncbi:ATPase-like, ParA/MinD [Thermodesulfobacterium geofontis OPF15]|jgi:Mrp family chromosome partitioning ATPase/predicted Fe-Mo cluster-binding NifX family protein|uniref:Iron-sulfur cluster carrier protein n=1 Tax=Thermodesulfobacterium geofontis (strain OPF15) TaxID=795359 RepID=F8C289_THEGP|nr:P-loop NTPase [Thermodesulfobacterium geofontis]AEH23347.1 ATPase-like, ParA/MinD [Thermodesulfobacterium geofontis OPF15]